ncbi:hypothetical protein LZG04_30290 [Saccharothrix sp. S26]|uniref:hypothetical protein n=1 Tax=Saccharothrix sp. S26 TaxID=2907215 RepID=UPI001F1D822A|nr:hypothetical protein [Saccharothrix sp. S26]MCE6999061.1 hypothetical protein [Saccharothrix sp. S26]
MDAEPEVVREAGRQLARLVRDGVEAAGAGVGLGGGFTSARLAGAHGDRRDAVLAAVQVLGVEGAHRLGDRSAVLVALFGPAATKRVGAAAHAAVADRRWGALRLASAASDLLGPEQVERVLELRAPDGIDPFPRGAASTLAGHLARVLAVYPRPRRLALVVSLWDHVCELLVERRRVARRAATQTRAERIPKLQARHREHFDEPVVRQMSRAIGENPTPAAAARWRPPVWWSALELTRLLHDAIAATALLRFAKTTSDEGLAVAVEKHRGELVAADACLTEEDRAAAARRREGDYSHPARPGCYVHHLVQALAPDRTITARTEARVKTRLAMARNYGVVVLRAVTDLLADLDGRPLYECWDACQPWRVPELHRWRAAAGFSRSPGGWEQPPLADASADGPTRTLAQRIAAGAADDDPASVEAPHDLLWFADLADALAPFHGNERAEVVHERLMPELRYDTPHDEPGGPRADSVPLAAAGVAQLVMFGATPPPRCGSWAELAARVGADAVVSEASVGAFPIPPELSTVDGQVIAGTRLAVELGRDPRQLAEWSAYMGNCIGESWYADRARKGQCVLMALRDPTDGRIVANLDVRRSTGGWHVHELRARFNDDVTPALEQRIKQWVDRIPPPAPPTPEPLVAVPPVRAGSARRSAAARLPATLTAALAAAVERELASPPVRSARRAYATLARGLGRPGQPADFEPDAAVVALKRIGPGEHVALLRAALDGGLGATALWQATRVRPLAAAVARLDPALRDHGRLGSLTDGSPLPRTLRALVRRPEVAPAHAMDVVARAVRLAMGHLLDDDVLARSVAHHPSTELVCALAIATTCTEKSTKDATVRVVAPRETAVPGFPAGDLSDEHGPWRQALDAAADLGAPVELFPDRVAERGLLVPAALLGSGGWPVLWQRAHR